MEALDSESGDDLFPLPSLVHLAQFSPVPPPLVCRVSSHFTGLHQPVESTRRRKLAYVSLQGVFVKAEEAVSATSIGVGLSPEQVVASELFTPVQRFLIVAVIGVAASESKKNRVIRKLEKSVDLRDQLLSNMQQKLDDLCEQLNLIKDQSGTGPNFSENDNLHQNLKESFGCQKIDFVDCGCCLCNQHRHLQTCLLDKPTTKASSGHEMHHETTNLMTGAEPEERRMSDMSDWCSSVTTVAEIHFNNLLLDQDLLYLRKECQDKDTTIKELTSIVQSTNKTSSKRISELEDIIRRKNTTITRLKKDLFVLEQKVTQLTRLQRFSSSAGILNARGFPMIRDNLLYDMDISTSPSSSDSETPVSTPRPTALKVPVVPFKEVLPTPEQTHNSAPAQSSASLVNSVKRPSASPLQDVPTKHKLLSVPSSSRIRRSSSTEASKKPKRQVQITFRDSSGPRKRWV